MLRRILGVCLAVAAFFTMFTLPKSDAARLSSFVSRPVVRTARTVQMPLLHGEKAIEWLKRDGTHDSLAEAMQAARYRIEEVRSEGESRNPRLYSASNPGQDFRTTFSADGMRLTMGGAKANRREVRLRLSGVGRGDQLADIAPATLSTDDNRIEFLYSPLIPHPSPLRQWFVNTPDGLEHGMTISESPFGDEGTVRIAFQLGGNLTARETEDGRSVDFLDRQGNRALRYDRLKVTDATDRVLPARLAVESGMVVWEIDDRDAVYPVTVDPTFTQEAKLLDATGGTNDQFGISVAVSGNTAVVGSEFADVGANANQGAAYVFVRSGVTWTQQAKLTAGDGTADDQFGVSVALDGNTAVVGANNGPGPAHASQGAAYVFLRTGTSWAQQAKLTAGDGAGFDLFGSSVGISGDTAVIGANRDQIGANLNQGSAYTFLRTGTSWAQ